MPKGQKKFSAIYLGWNGCLDVSTKIARVLRENFILKYERYFNWGSLLDQNHLARIHPDFLFNFSPIILNRRLLQSIRIAAINFHTGPPRWPGRGSCSFALYHGDKTFGVTAHIMTAKIDQGPILQVVRFPINKEDTAESLDLRTKNAIPQLAASVARDIQSKDGKIQPLKINWKRRPKTKKDMMRLMKIEQSDSLKEIHRKVRAFAHSLKPGPYLERAGFKFWFLPTLNHKS